MILGGGRRVGFAAAAVFLAALVAPAGAWAHATLVRSQPNLGEVVQQPPAKVTLFFSEPVATSLGSVSVLDAQLHPVDSGRLTHPQPNVVEVALPQLARGTYVVTWRVVSADTHPVHGAFTFSVGAPSAGADLAARAAGAQAPPEHVEQTFAVVRFVAFALLFLCVGGAFMYALVADLPRRVGTLLVAAAAALAVVSLFGLVCQGAEAGGTGFRAAFDGGVLADVLDSRFGQAWGIRAGIALWLAGVALLGPATRHVTAAVALALVPTTSLAAHAHVYGTGTVAVDLVHVVAAALWGGGLTFVLLSLLLEEPGARWRLAGRLVPRFSTVALPSVAVLVSAGVLNGYLEIRGWWALWHTSYGQLVLAKAALIVPILGLGAYNRRFAVPVLRRERASPVERRRFVAAALVEIALLTAILGVTAALVSEPPGKTVAAAAPTGPVSETKRAGPFDVELRVQPARAGANRVTVVARDRAGRLANVDEVRVGASLPGSGIASLPLDPRPAGRGRFVVARAELPTAGTWRLRVDVRRGEFDEWTAIFEVPIR
jgi:copper transport protein